MRAIEGVSGVKALWAKPEDLSMCGEKKEQIPENCPLA